MNKATTEWLQVHQNSSRDFQRFVLEIYVKKKIKKCIFITQQIHRGPSFMEAEVKFVKQLIVWGYRSDRLLKHPSIQQAIVRENQIIYMDLKNDTRHSPLGF